MDDFGIPLSKRWEILLDKLAAENPMPKSKPHFESFELHRLEHPSIVAAKFEGFNERN
jgi:hypothetical protein